MKSWVEEHIEKFSYKARKQFQKYARNAYRTSKKKEKAVRRLCRLITKNK